MNKRICDLFYIETGKDLIIRKIKYGPYPIISHTTKNNGVAAWSAKLENHIMYPKETITLADRGNFWATVQPFECYIGTRVKALIPKKNMTLREKIYYCMCINANQYRFNYGRNATNKVPYIELPNTIPSWVYETKIPDFNNMHNPYLDRITPELKVREWKKYKYSEIFIIKKGKRLTKKTQIDGDIPYISSSSLNNGIDNYIGNGYTDENCLTFACYGSIGEVFYHPTKVWVSDNANVLYLKNKSLNPFLSMFLITILKLEKFRFSYGVTGKKERLENLKIKLPANAEGLPDWTYMENYIKTLPYSKNL